MAGKPGILPDRAVSSWPRKNRRGCASGDPVAADRGEVDAPLAGLLGPVHGVVGRLQEAVLVVAVGGRDHQPDAAAQAEGVAHHLEGRVEHAEQTLAQRLSAALRLSDVIARVGGDEFIGLFPDVGNRDSLSFLGERLLGVFNEPFDVMGHRLSLSGSIGLVVAPEDGNDQDSLLKAADEAMYRAKQAGKRRIQLSAVGSGRAA